MNFKSSQNFIKLLALLLWSFSLTGADPRRGFSIFDFSMSGELGAAQVSEAYVVSPPEIHVGKNGVARLHQRYLTTSVKLLTSGRFEFDSQTGSQSQTLFQGLQQRALWQMFASGYVSHSIAAYAQSKPGDFWEPSQMRYVVCWTEITYKDAFKIFDGKIPWERLVGIPLNQIKSDSKSSDSTTNWETYLKQKAWADDDMIRLVGASTMVGVGWELDRAGNLVPLPLSWERAPIGDISATPMDTSFMQKIPYRAEISRTLVEKGLLGTELCELMRIAFSMLRREIAAIKGNTAETLVFARTFSKARARRFANAFHAREWTPELQSWFSSSHEDAFQYFSNVPRQTQFPIGGSIQVSTLSELENIRFVDNLSDREMQIARRSKTKLSREQAAELLKYEQDLRWRYFGPSQTRQEFGPVVLLDASFIAEALLVAKIVQLGVTDDEVINTLLPLIRNFAHHDPHPFTKVWNDNFYISTSNQPKLAQRQIIIQNIPESLLHNEKELMDLLASVYQHYFRLIENSSPIVLTNLLNMFEVVARNQVAYNSSSELARQILDSIMFSVLMPRESAAATLLKSHGGAITPAKQISRTGAITDSAIQVNLSGPAIKKMASARPVGIEYNCLEALPIMAGAASKIY